MQESARTLDARNLDQKTISLQTIRILVSVICLFGISQVLVGCDSDSPVKSTDSTRLTNEVVDRFVATMDELSDQQDAFVTIGDSHDHAITTEGAFATLVNRLNSAQTDILSRIILDHDFPNLTTWAKTGDRLVIAVLLVQEEIAVDALDLDFSDEELAVVRRNIAVLKRQFGMSAQF